MGSQHLEQRSRPHAATDAHRHHDMLRAAALAFDQRVHRAAGTGHAVGMADSDRAAIDENEIGIAKTKGGPLLDWIEKSEI